MTKPFLRFFGEFQLSLDGAPSDARLGRKARGLLCYLAARGERGDTRDALATMFWGDRFDEQARQSLRQTIATLRRALGDRERRLIASDDDRVRLDVDAVAVDTVLFEQALSSRAGAPPEEADLALYGGTVLDGLSNVSDQFDTWLSDYRRALAERAADGWARRLTTLDDDPGAREAAASRLIAIDRLREDGHRALMQALADQGKLDAAARQFRQCEELLARELDAKPSRATVALFEALQSLSRPETAEAPRAAATEAPRAAPSEEIPPPRRRRPTTRQLVLVALVAAVSGGIVAALASWSVFSGSESDAIVDGKQATVAILPFRTIGAGAPVDGLADGIAEGITAGLAIISNVFVIRPYSIPALGDEADDYAGIGAKLGVRYLVVGSVQRARQQSRVSVGLVEAKTGDQLWAQTFDRAVDDVFAVQDEVTRDIIIALQIRVTEGEQARISLVHGTRNLRAWLVGQQAIQHLRRMTRADNRRARALYTEAITIDPDYGGARDGVGWTHIVDVRFGWSTDPSASLAAAERLVGTRDDADTVRPANLALRAIIALLHGRHDEAIDFGRQALELAPTGAEVAALHAYALTYTGDFERSVELMRRAMIWSPIYPDWFDWNLGRALRLSGQVDEAIAMLEPSVDKAPDALAPLVELAAAYVMRGAPDRARAITRSIMAAEPRFRLSAWLARPRYVDETLAAAEHDILRRAGLPD